MSEVTIPEDLVSARNADLAATELGYGARIDYAKKLVDHSDRVLWYTDGVKLPPLIAAEKAEYYKGLKRINYSNPSNAWRMVKKYAFEYAVQKGIIAPPSTESEGEGEGEGEASSGDARHTRSFSLRVLEDVGTLFKAGRRLEKEGTLTAKEKQALTHLGSALGALGIDLATLK